jgi:UDP-galactopyranose mutase
MMAKKIKNLIVGAGVSGAEAERSIAESGGSVLATGAGGYAGDSRLGYRDKGIIARKYCARIFRVNGKEVGDFLSRFTKWRLLSPSRALIRGRAKCCVLSNSLTAPPKPLVCKEAE